MKDSIYKFKDKLVKRAVFLILHNPILLYSSIIIGMPCFIIIVVFIGTLIITAPIAWMIG